MSKGVQVVTSTPTRTWLRDAGVSLVELLVVVVIMGVVAGIAIPIYFNNQRTAAESQTKADLGQAADYITSVIEGGEAVDATELPGPFTDLGSLSAPLTIQVAEDGRNFCLAGTTKYGDSWYWDSVGATFTQEAPRGCPTPPPAPAE